MIYNPKTFLIIKKFLSLINLYNLILNLINIHYRFIKLPSKPSLIKFNLRKFLMNHKNSIKLI